MMHISESHLTR